MMRIFIDTNVLIDVLLKRDWLNHHAVKGVMWRYYQ